jgi:mono/diheme cytochrome c family protein
MLKKRNLILLFGIAGWGILCGNDPETKIQENRLLHIQTLPQTGGIQKSTKTDEGKTIYTKYCLACHQRDGSGVPGMYPPLQKTDWVNGDKKRLINILLHGLEGEIVVNGETYSQVMPKQSFLTDKQIAQVLTYIRQNMGNKGDSIKVKEVRELRDKK